MRLALVRRLLSLLQQEKQKPSESANASKPVSFYPEHVREKKKIQIGAPLHILRHIREQLEDYLTSINQNTEEIQANNEIIYQQGQQITKLKEMILEMGMSPFPRVKAEMVEPPLTSREQEVFLLLYTSEGFISQTEIAKRLGLTLALVRQFITSLMEKGVPITRKGIGTEVLMELDSEFKEIQARENVAGINEQLTLALATTGTFN